VNPDIDTLVSQTQQSIANDRGMAAMHTASADEKQKLLDALLSVSGELKAKEQECEEEHAARVRAEEALAKEQQRPLNMNVKSLTLGDNVENKYDKVDEQ